MKCQRCQKREATILIRQSINGKEKEYTLCQDCLYELGFANSFGFDLDNYLDLGFISTSVTPSSNQLNLSGTYNSGVFVPNKKETQVCNHCNTTLEEIRKKGKLGCSYCYESFDEQLGQVFRRIQSGDKHRGRKLAQAIEKNEIELIHGENDDLQRKIKMAVEIEDYISAAKWKTQILLNKEKILKLESSNSSENSMKEESISKKSNNNSKEINEKSVKSNNKNEINATEGYNTGKMETKKLDTKEDLTNEIENEISEKSVKKNRKNDVKNEMTNEKMKEKNADKKSNKQTSTQQKSIPKLDPQKKSKNGDAEGIK